MPDRAISLARASALLVQSVLAAMFAAAMLTGVSTAASAADDCLDNPDLRIREPGHWFYRSDRTQNRQCWHFEPATPPPATTTANTPPLPLPAPLATPAPATTGDTPQVLLSRFAAGLSETFSSPPPPPPPPPPQNTAPPPDTAGNAQQGNTLQPPPRRNKTARQDRPPAVPTTTGAATSEHQDQPRPDRRDPPLNVAEREALYQDFMKWQMERNVFGNP